MTADPGVQPPPRAPIDLHCHTSASFDSLADPRAVIQAAAMRGLTHLAITDHDGIDGALRARDLAPAGLTVIVGEECRTADGDLICLFLERTVASGMPVLETIAEVRAQGALVGIPHPFDGFRNSILRPSSGRTRQDLPGVRGKRSLQWRDDEAELASQVDWVEVYNARLIGNGNDKAAEFARTHSLPGVSVSDAHTVLEVGIAYSFLEGRPGTPAGLLAALAAGVDVVPRRQPSVRRAVSPMVKLFRSIRGDPRTRQDGQTPGDTR